MVNIMVISVVVREELQWVPRQPETRMIVDRLDRGEGEEPHSLPDTHTSEFESEEGTHGVFEEAFERMVVERAESIGDIEEMVAHVKSAVQPGKSVHCPVDRVLPGIDEEHCNQVLEGRHDDPVDHARSQHLGFGRSPGCAAVDQRHGDAELLRKLGSIIADERHERQSSDEKMAKSESPSKDISALAASVGLGFLPRHSSSQYRLEDMLDEDILNDMAHGHSISLQQLCWSMQFIFRQISAFVKSVKRQR